jgi:hypothetical protein
MRRGERLTVDRETPKAAMRFVVDSNVFDLLLAEGLVATVNRLQVSGECELLTTLSHSRIVW